MNRSVRTVSPDAPVPPLVPAVPDPAQRAARLLAGVETGLALSILDGSPDCIKLIELDGTLGYMNPNGLCAMGIDDFAQVSAALDEAGAIAYARECARREAQVAAEALAPWAGEPDVGTLIQLATFSADRTN